MPVLINKPKGMSSHDVVYRVRRATGIKKVGHAGTLDPLATGLLIMLVGREETKLQAQYMDGDKEYVAEITFGQVSETYDAEGPLTTLHNAEYIAAHITRQDIEAVLPQFLGDIQQRPPAHSAIKVQGQRLYKAARKGTLRVEDIPMREVRIDELEITDYTPPVLQLRIACGKGTYIRSLAHDLGQALGCGAYMSELKRTKIGSFSVDDAQDLDAYMRASNSIDANSIDSNSAVDKPTDTSIDTTVSEK